jgi:NitT/TauT family transport system substrate-binding protein
MKKALGAAALAVAALTLSACSGGSTPTDTSPVSSPTETTEAPLEQYTVRVAALPIAETGALWAAIDEGIFEKHGITVEIVPAQGGAQAIPALLSGDIQFAIGQPFGPFRADGQDLGIVIISDYANSLPDGKDVNAVVALDSSGIDGPADLAGKRVSVNSLGAAGDVTIMQAVKDAGGDPTTIEFVEVAFPEVPAQLAAGTIDAAWAPDPFMSIVDGGDGHIVVHPYQATIPGLTVLTNITTQDILDNEPQMVAQYSAAMEEALAWANENEDAVRAAIATNLEIPEEAAAGITLPMFNYVVNVDDLDALAGLAVDFGVLPAKPNFDRLVQQQ